MKIDQLQHVVMIAECGTLGKAAEKLHVSQPTLSMSIKHLENELGSKIFERGRNGATLTPLGNKIYRRCKGIITQVDSLISLCRDNDEKETLSVSNTFSLLGKKALMEIYNIRKGENLDLYYEDCLISKAIDNVAKGKTEIGVIRLPSQSKVKFMNQLHRHHLMYFQLDIKKLYAVVGNKNPYYHIENDYVYLKDLERFPLALFSDETSESLWSDIEPFNKYGRNVLSFSNESFMAEMIRNTNIYTLDTPKHFPPDHKWFKQIRYIPVEPEIPCEFGIIQSKNRNLSTIALEYIDCLKEFLNKWNMKLEGSN